MGLVIYLGINSGFNSDWHSVVKGKVRSRRNSRGSKSPQNQRPDHDQMKIVAKVAIMILCGIVLSWSFLSTLLEW